MKKLVVLGGGKSGIGAALLAKKNDWNVFVSDKGIITDKEVLTNNDIKWEEGSHSENEILSADEIVKSPGIPDGIKIIQLAKENRIPVISEVEFAYRYTNAKIVAISGSNGKTTTTLLVGHILKNAGYDVLVTGNIGTGFARSILERDYDYIVLELSSFQLDGIVDFKADVAIILNITPDHLDRYNNDFQLYVKSKLKITNKQEKKDFLIYNIDDENIKNHIETSGRKIPFSIKETIKNDGAFYKNKQININLNNNKMTIQELALQGKHNVYNSMAAAVACRVLEVKDYIIRQSLLDFQNIEHRLEYVLTVHGIDFINDSKATNINSVWYALESMHKQTVWIVGGVDKGNNYDELLELVKDKVKAIVCIGEDTQSIHETFGNDIKDIVDAKSMSEAVSLSFEFATKGENVLLSPACASFDMFQNFEHRGIEFKNSVRKL
ncbi:MAG: UDP-N-acetylmuramoyl-L-alanine--D-glutamate ligase [Flavobacteriales bacterium]|jgi:UDP-N-acetylmuramoylalanine--D-glutamate ligase|nr:UDP-N-acetylmuramoyl-L-alanine--D-glutamate ligase [Flavobacteriales bacterium]MBT6013395.1 UDP-N-acetylmuramoyl-L-alanine--D-glutamate ligase [Flavobacteriales bacterium]MBT7481730.1 UDP-N-acetylmuramoyl-L-alanine--D-glutamate ligase [Flavobacteriales bacterium]